MDINFWLSIVSYDFNQVITMGEKENLTFQVAAVQLLQSDEGIDLLHLMEKGPKHAC